MPTYEYVCIDCGEKIEVQASISEKEKGLKVVCSKCGSSKVARVFGSFNIFNFQKGGSMPPACGPNAGSGCCG
jgi:putative FmdB family regulatory protein